MCLKNTEVPKLPRNIGSRWVKRKKKGQSNSPYVSQIFCSFNNFLDKTVFQKVFA